MEQSPLALQIFRQGQEDAPEACTKNDLFSPYDCLPCGTKAWHTPYSEPICIPLMAQSLWKSNGPHWKHVRGRPTIVLSFRTIVLKTAQKRPFLDEKSAMEWARRLKTARNLFVVMRVCSSVVLSYLDAGFERRCRRNDFSTACCCQNVLLTLCPKKGCKTSTR